MRPHDAQHPRAGDSDPIQDPKPCVDLAMAFAVERGPREIGPNRRQQLRVRLPRRRPPPARGAARSPSTAPRCAASPRRAPPPRARRDEPLSRARGQPWPAPATRRAGRSPRPPHGTAPRAIRHAVAAAPRRASGWRSTAAPAPGSPARPPPRRQGLQSPSGLPPSAPIPLPVPRPSTEPFPPPPWTLDSPLIRVQENRGALRRGRALPLAD